jgi:signal peptidase I
MSEVPSGRRSVARTLLSFLVLWLPLVSSAGVRPLIILGCSMEPALQSGQLVLLHDHYYRSHSLCRGDVVVFHWDGHTCVKRVFALPGETIQLVQRDGYSIPLALFPEGKAQRLARAHACITLRTVRVPPDHFFCLGDNLGASLDSRDLGPIPTSAIMGRVETF